MGTLWKPSYNVKLLGCSFEYSMCRDSVSWSTVHTWSSLLTSCLAESDVLNKKDRQNMKSGGTLGLEFRTTDLDNPITK